MTTAVEVFSQYGVLVDGVSLTSRAAILALEDRMIELYGGGEHTETFPLTHRFADGVYAREILLPAGTLVIGKIHRYAHLNIITKGRVAVLTEFGVEELEAPYTFTSLAGTKRVVFAYEDTIWTTLHGTQHTDPDTVEEDIICKSFEEFDALQLLIEEKL